MMVDISATKYEVELIDEKGVCYLITEALLNLEWEEREGELSQRANITVKNILYGSTTLAAIAKINCIVLIYAKWNNAPKSLVFKGTIWEWPYKHDASQKELTIMAYDHLIRLQQSQDFRYYPPGMTTQFIINDICVGRDPKQPGWNISYQYKWEQSVTHEKKVFNGAYVSNMIISLLEEVRKKTGEKYVIYWRDNALQIVGYGTNKEVYKFENGQTVSVYDKLTINNLVTRVKIIGKSDDNGDAPIEAIVDGDTWYGVLQAIIQSSDDTSLADMQAQADTILKERGKPQEEIRVTVPDLPFLRKGDVIEAAAGNLTGFFNVLGVSHNATQKQMSLSLERKAAEFSPPQTSNNTNTDNAGNIGTFARGDTVILNGYVYGDSHGNGRGRAFTDYHSTVTIVAALTRACPYHVGSVGWVYPSDVTRG